jgi:DsbC/DsbD-like thiol-disulfide interchange protein
MLARASLGFILLTFVAAFAAVAWAQTAPNTQVSLVSDVAAAAPGSTVWVGIHFQLEPGWHIYWVNPGDSGEPARVQWRVPTGWSAGPISWPAPTRMQNPAGVDYGYHDEATLLTKVKVSPQAKPGSTNQLNADANWLVCKEICIAQQGSASVTMRVAAKSSPDSSGKTVIEAAKARLPKPVPEDWKANVMKNPRNLLLNFMPGVKVESAEFFPLERQIIENAGTQKLSSTSTRAQLALPKDTGAAAAKSLRGVLVLNGTDAYAINILIK